MELQGANDMSAPPADRSSSKSHLAQVDDRVEPGLA